jgi:hypothetical protein
VTPVPIGNAPTVKTRAKINPCGGKKQLESTHQTRWAMARGIHPMKPFFLVKSVWITVKSREKSQKNPIQSLWTTMKLTFNKLPEGLFHQVKCSKNTWCLIPGILSRLVHPSYFRGWVLYFSPWKNRGELSYLGLVVRHQCSMIGAYYLLSKICGWVDPVTLGVTSPKGSTAISISSSREPHSEPSNLSWNDGFAERRET